MSETLLRRVTNPEDDRIKQDNAARGARIDKLSVDRTRWIGMKPMRWSPEAEAREPEFEGIRSETTLAERVDAWKQMFAKTAE